MSWQLSTGAIEGIMTGQQYDNPIFQVLGQKKIAGNGAQGADRYRLLLSDGKFSHSSAMLATQLNDKVTSGELDTFAVIKLDRYLCNQIQQDRRVMILLEVTVLGQGSEVQSKIGNPVPFKVHGGGSAVGDQQPAQSNGALGTSNVNAKAAPPPTKGPDTGMQSKSAGFYGQQNSASAQRPGAAFQQNVPFGNQNLPPTPGGTPAKVHPIASLTPYQNRWTIRARVSQKGNIRKWSNSRGEGQLFSMNLLDESGEIKATAFREEVDRFFEMVQVNKVYFISKAALKTADKRYSTVDNDYEMTFNRETTMVPCDDAPDLPTVSFNFVPINALEKVEANNLVDVIGIVKSAADVTTITTKQTGREVSKRDLQLVDENRVMIRMTLWGADAESFQGSGNPVLSIKGARLSDWGGRSLSALTSSQVLINPDIPECHRLRGWYDNVGHSLDFEQYHSDGAQGSGGMSGSGTNWKTFMQTKQENLGQDKADYFTTKATVVFLRKENCMYTACPEANCNKKVIDQGNGMYRCEKCQKEYPNYKWRMILSVNLADHTDNQWATCFQDSAEVLLGKSAEEIGILKEQDETNFENLFQEANFKSYIFKLRAKVETYNDEQRLKTVCVTATPIDYRDYSNKLIGDITQLLQQ